MKFDNNRLSPYQNNESLAIAGMATAAVGIGGLAANSLAGTDNNATKWLDGASVLGGVVAAAFAISKLTPTVNGLVPCENRFVAGATIATVGVIGAAASSITERKWWNRMLVVAGVAIAACASYEIANYPNWYFYNGHRIYSHSSK